MSSILDVRGLSCPQPVIQVQKAIQQAVFPIEVLVDSIASKENVRRLAEREGCKVTIDQQGDEYTLVLRK